jgi:pimeloyl-ACP methyl ester carboxylesterase
MNNSPGFREHQFVELRGIKIAYTQAGKNNKECILFIHGLGENLQTWTRNISILKKDFHCIAIDLPGHGLSDKGNHPYSPYFFASIVNEIIVGLGLRDVILTGHSLGGQVAIMAALSNISLVKKLVLIAPAGFENFSEQEERWLINHSKNYLNPITDLSIFSMIQDTNNNFPTNEIYSKIVTGMLDQPVFDHLHQIEQPTLVIFGENDPFIPNRFLHHDSSPKTIAETGTKQIRNASLNLIPGTGHFIHIEKADMVNRLITGFIDKRGS